MYSLCCQWSVGSSVILHLLKTSSVPRVGKIKIKCGFCHKMPLGALSLSLSLSQLDPSVAWFAGPLTWIGSIYLPTYLPINLKAIKCHSWHSPWYYCLGWPGIKSRYQAHTNDLLAVWPWALGAYNTCVALFSQSSDWWDMRSLSKASI